MPLAAPLATVAPKSMKPNLSEPRWDAVPWQDQFGVGHATIDADHKRLFELFNEFVAAVNANSADSDIQGVLSDLLDYTDTHFDREEGLMQAHAYPDFTTHKAMHDAFVRQLHDVNSALDAGGEKGAFVLGFLGKWLTGHILGVDKKLGAYLKERGVEE
ncbi:bacteriohemerythrin [Azospirillum canadense]|uniref:bacteriohemerythrin n=1 Tax=Azospirillum canadense TaxID=403962 RepID=UPI002227C774|nr:bacteriohemerythrin [Azospirillum canadense]MCW2236059.1 hemerythrin [Azospirillum canadense]